MIGVRLAETDADLARWTEIRNRVETDEPTTLEQLRDGLRRRPETRHWLVEDGGDAVGCGFVAFSSVPGRVYVLPRVVADARGRGAGSALYDACLAYARALGGERVRTSVDGRDERSLAFAARRGFEEVDRQVELVRPLVAADDPAAALPAGVELDAAGGGDVAELDDLLAEGVADMPVVGGVGAELAAEIRDELERAVFRVVARERGEPVGVAGLLPYGARDGALEHAFTTVLRTHRGRGIAQALKAACVRWAAANGYRELVTWTQTGNEPMQAVNVAAGFRTGSVSITLEAPLASVGADV